MEENKEIKKSKKIMTFDEWFELAKEYKEKHGNLLVPSKYVTETGKSLGKWIVSQRQNYDMGKLSIDKIKKLESIGMVWKIILDWNEMYELAEEYYKKNGNLLIRRSYVAKNGERLGVWIATNRRYYAAKKLPKEKQEKLEAIGMVWKLKSVNDWNEKYKLARKYYMNHGNLLVPVKYVSETGISLGIWIALQRNIYKKGKLSQKRIAKLESIGMIWQAQEKTWNEMYKLATDYFKKYGNLLVPKDYVTENGTALNVWISNNRTFYVNKRLSKERIEKLEKIGMVWNTFNDKWNIMFKIAEKYYLEHGNLLTQDTGDKKLDSWIIRQRKLYATGKLSKEQIEKLDSIGMAWKLKEGNWSKNYDLAKAYYIEHSNLLVSRTGIEKSLGDWIYNQRKLYTTGKLSKEQIEKLNSIGMVWDLKTNKDDINNYLETLPITIDKKCNKEVLKRMSLIELQTKMQFLNDIGVSPVDELGNLIDIFSMSSYDIEEKYGVRIESLIEYYKNVNSRRLCV